MWFVKHRCLSIITINQQLCGHHFAWQPGCVEKSTCQVRGVTSFPSKEQWNSHSESVRCPLRASPVNKMSKHLLIREHRTQDVKASKASDGNSWRAWLWGSLESSQSSEVVSPGGTNDCRRGFTASLWETGAFTLHVHGPKSSGRFWDVLFFFDLLFGWFSMNVTPLTHWNWTVQIEVMLQRTVRYECCFSGRPTGWCLHSLQLVPNCHTGFKG